MIRANKLTQLEGPRNVDEFGKSGDFGEILPMLQRWQNFVKVVEQIISEYMRYDWKAPETWWIHFKRTHEGYWQKPQTCYYVENMMSRNVVQLTVTYSTSSYTLNVMYTNII